MNTMKNGSPKEIKLTALCVGMLGLSALLFLFYAGSEGVEARPSVPHLNPVLPVCQSQAATINVFDVGVAAVAPRVRQATAFNDCCAVCEEQVLQALVPTPQGAVFLEADGRLPLRRKFCGTITKYGVNDETDDPRDITINLRPAPIPPYPSFLKGFANAEEATLKGDDIRRFGPSTFPFTFPRPLIPITFNLQDCLRRADEIRGKVIHTEVTPDEHFYGADARFLPIESTLQRCGGSLGQFGPIGGNPKCLKCISGWDCQSELEPSSGAGETEACVYGVYSYDHGSHSSSAHRQLCQVLDLGHDTPEIHPFDAIWWRHPDRKGWIFGVFQDDSNRYSFPHCGSQNNGNEWSQAPRDLTFTFPFKFPLRSGPQQACLRHVRSRKLKDNAPSIVSPLNVTTAEFVNPATEVTALVVGKQRLLQLVKEIGSERETHVRIQGGIVGDDVVGQIILRVAVGCDDRTNNCVRPTGPRDHRQTIFDGLLQTNRLAVYDKNDPGAGYFYAELTFDCSCPTR